MTDGPARVRILLVDDHPVFRDGLRRLLEADPALQVVGEADSAAEALEAFVRTAPALVILDVSLPDQSGVDLLPRLKALRREVPVLFLSAHPESGFALPLLRAGAQGYIGKQRTPALILEAVHAVAAGRGYRPAELVAPSVDAPAAAGPRHSLLSRRELQVFTRIARGLPPAATAAELQLSVKTVGTYRSRILEKLGVASNAELAAYAVRNHLLDTAIH